jgi:hypothetical protein
MNNTAMDNPIIAPLYTYVNIFRDSSPEIHLLD